MGRLTGMSVADPGSKFKACLPKVYLQLLPVLIYLFHTLATFIILQPLVYLLLDDNGSITIPAGSPKLEFACKDLF